MSPATAWAIRRMVGGYPINDSNLQSQKVAEIPSEAEKKQSALTSLNTLCCNLDHFNLLKTSYLENQNLIAENIWLHIIIMKKKQIRTLTILAYF